MKTIWSLMNVNENTSIELTDHMAMLPGAAVCGVYFSHEHAKYFSVGKITKEQIESYASRKQITKEEAERWLSSILSYDRDGIRITAEEGYELIKDGAEVSLK
ncbi:hypothetical protein ACTFIY_012017 [Dictyostelium cf. discoideum]